MDLAKQERAEAAQIYNRLQLSDRDKGLIANVLRNCDPGINQSLALGQNCPYTGNRAMCALWTAEIRRQRGEADPE
jgi:hypothetical protein